MKKSAILSIIKVNLQILANFEASHISTLYRHTITICLTSIVPRAYINPSLILAPNGSSSHASLFTGTTSKCAHSMKGRNAEFEP